jgi:hypothetical protein
MKQILLFFLIFITIMSCSKQPNSKQSWNLNFGETNLKSMTEIQIGLNLAEFSSPIKENDFSLSSDMGEIAYEIRDKSLWFAIEKGTTVTFTYKNQSQSQSISVKEKINVKNDSVWIATFEPQIAVYGRHKLSFQVFRKSNGKWSKSYEDVDFIPWMNMGNGYGHSSQYNVSPVLIDTLGGRLYRGMVSFSMPGDWEMKFITFNDTLSTLVTVIPQK